MKKTIVSLIIVMTLSACVGPTLLRRYSKAQFGTLNKEHAEDYVTVKLQSYPKTTKTAQFKGILDLSDHGQQAYISALSKEAKDADDFVSKLILPLEFKQPKPIKGRPKFTRQLVFSIENEKGLTNRANRIDSIKLTLTLKKAQDKAKARFSTWDRIVTNYQSIDVGKLTLGNKTSFSLSPEFVTPAGATEKIGAVSYEKSRQEEVGIKDRLVISGTLTDGQAILSEKGVAGMDLAGNLIAEVDFEVTDAEDIILFSFDNLFNKDGDPEKDEKKIKINETQACYANFPGNIEGNLEYEFVFREVKKGEKTFLEGDDEVVFQSYKGTIDNVPPLIKADEFVTEIWRINDGKDKLYILFRETEEPVLINFPSFDEARTFLKWLKASKSTKINGNEIRIGKIRTITQDDLQKLQVELLKKPEQPNK